MAKEISIGVKLVTDLKDFTSGFKQAQDTSKKFGDNIEKNVSTPLNKLTGQLRNLKAAQSRSLTPEQFAQTGEEIKKVQGEIDKFKGKLSSTSGPLDGILSQAKGLLPAFGFAAIAAGAGMAIKSIIASTSATADEFEFMVTGMKTGLSQFFQIVATGDWSNFTGRMNEAIQAGYNYASMLDKIQDQTRGMSMIESDAADEAINLEIKLRNKLLTKSERIKAGQERIALEEKLVKSRKFIAEEGYQNEVNEAKRQTQLSEAQLVAVAKDINSQKRLDAEAYNEKVDQLKKIQQAKIQGSSYSFGNTAVLTDVDNSELITKLKAELDATKENIKEYATLLKRYDILNDESQANFTASYVKKNEAAVSGKENIKKIISQVNSLLAGEEENGSKIANSTNTYAEKLKKLTTQLDETNTSDTEAIRLIYAKINALNQLEAASEAVRKSIRNGSDPMSGIKPIGSGQLSTTPIDAKTLAINSPINADAIAAEIKKINDAQDALIEKQQAVQSAFQSGFQAIGQSVINGLGLADTGFQGFVKNLANTVTQLISMFLAQSLSSSIAGATVSGASTGPAAIFTTPAFIATAIGGVLSAFAAIPKFATGGIVPGSSFTGDRVLARVNSGEEILRANDPRHSRNGSNGSSSSVAIINEAQIKGEDLYILMKKVEQRIARRT